MKPPPFAYVRPETLEETLELLAADDRTLAILAGGQSLVPMLNFRLGAPDVLVDVNRLPGLDGITADDGLLRIGALTRHAALVGSKTVTATCPVVSAAAGHIGHTPIRNRGTAGGSIAHADPASELPCVAALLDAQVELASLAGTRRSPFSDFVLGPLTTSRRPEELVTAIELSAPEDAVYGFSEISQRTGDFALAGAAACLTADADGLVRSSRIALFGVEAVPRRLSAAEELLRGRSLSQDGLAEVLAAVERDVEPLDDGTVPPEYRRRLAAVAVERAIADAHQDLPGGTQP